jgi:glycosyltransferase involved in cell wall biosynthesis
MVTSLKILCLADEPWDDIAKRNQCLLRDMSQDAAIASLLYVNPPVFSSVNDVVRGRFMPSHLGQDRNLHWRALCGRAAHQVSAKVWTYTGSQKALPHTRFAAVRRWGGLKHTNMFVYCSFIRRYLNRLPGQELVVWLSHPLHAFAIEAFSERTLLVYDWMDDWEQFDILPVKDPTILSDLTDRVIKEADVVFAVSETLWQRAKAMNHNAFLMPNATDFPLADEVAGMSPPESELAALPAPRIGYAGQLGDKFDFSLVHSIAQARPDWSVVLIGPVWHTHREKAHALTALDNVHFLGRRPRSEMPHLLRGLDVCIIPHLLSALTMSMDPIKIYDYMSTGKPIVSTGVAGVERFGDVIYVGNGLEEFLTNVETALQEGDGIAHRRLAYAQQNTWSKRAEQVWEAIKAVSEL